jgi:glycerophosphoryl diester phosphodiesterase
LALVSKFKQMKNIAIIVVCLLVVHVLSAQQKYVPEIIAHRGASSLAPENTLAAFRLGWQQAKAVETDAYLTADKRIVLIHDGTTQRTTGRTYKVSETHSDTLRMLDAGGWKSVRYAGEKIPFIEEALAILPKHKTLVIHIKSGAAIIAPLKQALIASGKEKQCVIISFDYTTLATFKTEMPSVPMYFLINKLTPLHYANSIDLVKQARIEGLDVSCDYVVPELVTQCKAAGVSIYAYTVDNIQEAEILKALHVDGITTNIPGVMSNELWKK